MCVGDSSSSGGGGGGDNQGGLGDVLAEQVAGLFETAPDLPVTSSRSGDGFSMEVRLRFGGNDDNDKDGAAVMTSIAEARIPGIPPSAFKGFLVNFKESMEADPAIQRLDIVRADGDGDPDDDSNNNNSGFRREGVRLFLKFPFPLSNRVMVHWKYLSLGYQGDPDEHLLILSERDNEALLETVLPADDRRGYVLGRTFLAAYWIQPLRENGNGGGGTITGTTIKYVFSGDLGGSIPAKIQEWTAPQNMLRTIQSVVTYGRNHHHHQAAAAAAAK